MEFPFPPELVTKAGAAYMLGCSERDITTLMHQNKLVAIDDGHRKIKFRYRDIVEHAESLSEAIPD